MRGIGRAVDGRLEMDFRGLAFRTRNSSARRQPARNFCGPRKSRFPGPHTALGRFGGRRFREYVECEFPPFPVDRQIGMELRHKPLPARAMPATATINYDYSNDREEVAIDQSEISTPNTQLEFSGLSGGQRFGARCATARAEPDRMGRLHQHFARRRT